VVELLHVAVFHRRRAARLDGRLYPSHGATGSFSICGRSWRSPMPPNSRSAPT
jgi:hypothetical protein